MANPPNPEDNFIIGEDENQNQYNQPVDEYSGLPDDFDENQNQQQYDNFEHEQGLPGDEEFGAFEPRSDEVEIDNSASAVASAPAKNILIIIIMVIIMGFVLYKYVFKESPEEIASKKIAEQAALQPVTDAQLPTKPDEKPSDKIGVVDTPSLPEMETVQAPPLAAPEVPKIDTAIVVPAPVTPPLPPVNPVDVVKPAEPTTVVTEPAAEPQIPLAEVDAGPTGPTPEERMMARRKSGMMIINGGGTPSQADMLDAGAVGKSSVTPIKATKVEDLGLMILQGKMLDAILETTINTDLPGSLRAVISRDIYAESGKTILIPRGSRLIGTYGSNIQSGQKRVIVTWGRVIRPDGVDIDIASSGTDQLGRAGMTGIVDNKYYETFGNALLVSAVTIGGSIMLNSVQKAQAVTTSTSTGGAATGGGTTTTQTSSPTDAAVLQSVQSLGDTARKVVDMGSTQPTIIVNQGARVKVFVNKDLIFPSSVVKRVSSGN